MSYLSSYEKRLQITLWLAIALSFFFNLHAVPLFDVDEGAYSEVTREMFERGDFISPHLYGLPFFDKPILMYWMQAISVAAFGINEFAFRLPAAIAATLWVMVVFWFVRRTRTLILAYYAAIATALSFTVSVIGKGATTDAFLNLCIAGTMFAIYLYYKERDTRFVYGAFACMALGFLTKGPIAVLIPFAVSLIFFALKREWRAWFKAVTHPGGLLLFVAIALPWYAMEYHREGRAFLDGFFFKHNLSRFQAPMERHSGNLFYYVPVTLLAILPFTAVVLKMFTRIRAIVRDDLMLYCALWFLFVFAFFSFSGTKLPHYLSYGITGLIILIALFTDELKSRWLSLVPTLLFFGGLFALPQVFSYAALQTKDTYMIEVFNAAATYTSREFPILLVVSMAICAALVASTRLTPTHKMIVSGFFVVIVTSELLIPLVGEVLQSPVREAGLIARRENYPAVVWHLDAPSFSVYAQRATPRRKPEPGEFVLMKEKYLSELPNYEVLFRKNGIVLAKYNG